MNMESPSSSKKKTYYEILGVSSEATTEDIKKAYKPLVLKHHPDKNPENQKEAQEKTAELNEAYSVLSDEKRRKQYDEILSGKIPFNGSGFDNMDEIFQHSGNLSDFLHGMFGSRVNRGRYVINGSVGLTLKEALEGVKNKEIEVVPINQKGVASQPIHIKIDLPPGLWRGEVVEIPYTVDGKETIFRVRVGLFEDDSLKNFMIHRNGTVITQIVINYPTAVIGGTIEVTLLDGTKKKLKIPEGTQPGNQIKVDKGGLPYGMNEERAPLFFEILVEVPKKVTKEQRKLLEKLEKSFSNSSTKSS